MNPTDTAEPEDPAPEAGPVLRGLVPSIQISLRAKIERLLRRPIIARVVLPAAAQGTRDEPDEDEDGEEEDELPDMFRAIEAAARSSAPNMGRVRRESPWREDPRDGTYKVSIAIDYADLWRDAEKEILEAVHGTIENHVAFLTDEQHLLLRRSPREFMDLQPKPESAELIAFRSEVIGGSERVVELTIAAAPEARTEVHHIAIVPNLIPLERQLMGVGIVDAAGDDGPLAPLRALLGLNDSACLAVRDLANATEARTFKGLDASQAECVRNALDTPHFAVIKGPPGSGKTTVISTIIRHALERGERVLVVSPTHVAVDNVVEKLAPKLDYEGPDDLERRSLPVRYAAKPGKLSKTAFAYWIGPKKQRRGAIIAKRVERRLTSTLPFAEEVFGRLDDNAQGHAPISAAVASVQGVICGTPIGILSYQPVKDASPASFDLLVVDEVSKMTLPEFIAVAVKTRRWVLVGDPEQLPPYNSAEENGETLDDIVGPILELACSVGAILERLKPALRQNQRLVVVSSDPDRAADCICAHLDAVELESGSVSILAEWDGDPIVVCAAGDIAAAVERVSPATGRDRTHNPEQIGTVHILVERGLSVPRPELAGGTRFVEAKARSQVRVYETAFNVYHAQPWSVRTGQRLWLVESRRGLEKYLASAAAIRFLEGLPDEGAAWAAWDTMMDKVAGRFAVNAVSVYDWLTGIPTADFDAAPLRQLAGVADPLAALRIAVEPYVGTLRKQYRMHPSLSRVPREHFYFGEALDDGKPGGGGRSRVGLVQVVGEREEGEVNESEAAAIRELLQKLNGAEASKAKNPQILIITPYRKQERRLKALVDEEENAGSFENIKVEVCTLDRCQGRESEYVFISLVRNRASAFLDAPKRWNVALTRAMEGLFIFGDIDSYLREAGASRRGGPDARPLSLLARLLDAYQRQNSVQPGTPSPRSAR